MTIEIEIDPKTVPDDHERQSLERELAMQFRKTISESTFVGNEDVSVAVGANSETVEISENALATLTELAEGDLRANSLFGEERERAENAVEEANEALYD